MPRSPKASGVDPAKEPLGKEHSQDQDEETDESDEDDILEVSENGRYKKFNEQVTRDIPGIDAAYLAMDTDDGVEVVWNEVRYSSRKSSRKEMLVKILQRLSEFKHTNIVNFITFWHDRIENHDRLVFITEYMTSGSLLQFLKKAKRTKKSVTEKMWRRWCRQILSALSYLHQNKIVHGNVSLATIFIQHNGLVKIGSVSPDAIHEHVKTKSPEETTRLHYASPELATAGQTTAADIYAFGICTLEMLNLDLLGNSEGRPTLVNQEAIQLALGKIQDPKRAFIELCLQEDPAKRPKASTLLKHAVLQEMFTLKVLSTLALSQRESRENVEVLVEKYIKEDGNHILAELPHVARDSTYWRVSQVPRLDLDNLYEEITLDVLYHNDFRPQTANSPQKKDNSSSRTAVPSSNLSTERNSTQFMEESRRIVAMNCDLKSIEGGKMEVFLKVNFEDKMQRELYSELKEGDDAASLAWDLVVSGLINEEDRQKITDLLDQKLRPISAIEVHS